MKAKRFLALLAIVAVVHLIAAPEAKAQFSVEKDSADFVHLYEANAMPDVEDTGSSWAYINNTSPHRDFTAANGLLSFSSMGAAGGMLINPSAFAAQVTTGTSFTLEYAAQVTGASSDTSTLGGLMLFLNNGAVKCDVTISTNSIAANGALVASSLDNTTMHSYRIAFDSTVNKYALWRDGSLISDTIATSSAGARLYLGDGSGAQAGAADIDYFRWDMTGAYAPVPEPTTLGLLATGGLMCLRRRRKNA